MLADGRLERAGRSSSKQAGGQQQQQQAQTPTSPSGGRDAALPTAVVVLVGDELLAGKVRRMAGGGEERLQGGCTGATRARGVQTARGKTQRRPGRSGPRRSSVHARNAPGGGHQGSSHPHWAAPWQGGRWSWGNLRGTALPCARPAQVADTASSYLCQELRGIGYSVLRAAILPDSVGVIADEVRRAADEADVVLTCGGIGPTLDDVTVEGVAMALGRPLAR